MGIGDWGLYNKFCSVTLIIIDYIYFLILKNLLNILNIYILFFFNKYII